MRYLTAPVVAVLLPVTAVAGSVQADPSPAVESAVSLPHRGDAKPERDGRTPETAYKVRNVQSEYKIMRKMGLDVRGQALVAGKRSYDVLTGVDPKTGEEHKVWFDIGSFYGF